MNGDLGFLGSGAASAHVQASSAGQTPSLPWSNEEVGLNDIGEVVSIFTYFTALV